MFTVFMVLWAMQRRCEGYLLYQVLSNIFKQYPGRVSDFFFGTQVSKTQVRLGNKAGTRLFLT